MNILGLINRRIECYTCGSLMFSRSPTCLKCQNYGLSKVNLREQQVQGLTHRYLLGWTSMSPFTGRLIEALKYHENAQAWDCWTRALSLNHLVKTKQKPLLLVPSPGLKRCNHALGMTKSISKQLMSEYRELLIKSHKVEQKKRTRKQRSQLKLTLSENISKYEKEKYSVVFVDDVLTTGFTAKAAYIALGAPTDFEVWTLAYRASAYEETQT